ncbi:MAG: TonB-dependent receptor [Crocinitomicaceae bacterium]|nr:TonB-dependent receptor [Crocinitomicaceae bacterium]MCF8433767.1 TonB-dependent receptor [Crocinitomicaceae bacterium]
MKNLYIVALLFIGISSISFGQKDGILTGRIVDKLSDKPMEYVSFRLFSVKDSSVVAGIFTDPDGRFNLEQLAYGNFYGKLTFSGYETISINDIKISASIKSVNLGTYKMIIDKAIDFEEVKVVGQLDVLKAGIDKKIYNVGEDLSVKGGTANDVLNNIPSVEVDQDGRIMLRGDGTVTVLIDGRPSSLSGGNGKSLLDALPAGSIERIEVVTNPSAKYDPDGTSGIINIVLKKNKLKGFNGMLTANVGSGNLNGGNVADGSFSLSYRNGRFNAYGSYSGRYMAGYRNNYSSLEQTFSDNSSLKIVQNRLGTDLNAGHTFRVGSDFYLKPRHVIGFSATGSIGQRDRTGDQWNTSYDGDGNVISFWNRTSYDPTNQENFDLNVNYKFDLKDDKGSFIIDANQSLGKEEIEGYYEQTDYNLDSTLIGSYLLDQQLLNTEKNNVTTVQSDFTYLLPKKKARIETGLKAIVRQQGVDTYSESLNQSTQEYAEDTLANFIYQYDEQIYSAYGIFGQELGKFKYQAGVRLEQSYQIPNLISDTIRIVNDFFNFFPSAHIRYAFTPKSEVSLSYSRRINRAGSSNLNPFTNYSDPYNLQRGNPNLQPEYIDSYDLGYTNERKKVTLTTSIFYRYTTGVITRIKEFYADNTSAVTYANIDKSYSFGTEMIFIVKPTTWWRNSISGNANYIQYDDNTNSFNRSGFNWNLKYSGTFDFWKKTASIQINGTYNAPRITVQGTARRRGALDISGEKKFKDGMFSVGFRVSDIFNRQGFEMQVNQPTIRQDVEFKWLTRKYFVTFTYKFGKLEISKKNQGGGGEGGFDM